MADLYNLYNEKYKITPVHLKSVKESFLSETNKIFLLQVIYNKLFDTRNDDIFNKLQLSVNDKAVKWVDDGNLNKL